MASVFCSKYLRYLYLKKGISVLAAYVLQCSSSAVSEPPSAPRPHCTALYCTCTAQYCTVLHCTALWQCTRKKSAVLKCRCTGTASWLHISGWWQPQSTVMSQGNNLGHNEAVVALNLPLHSENRPYIIGDNITTVSSCHQWVTFEWFIRAFFSILILMDILFVPL